MASSFPHSINIPDFSLPFSLSYHVNGDSIAAGSDQWFKETYVNMTEKQLSQLYGLKAGILVGLSYHYAIDDNRLRVVCDFMNILFHLDDLSDPLSVGDTVNFAQTIMNALASPQHYERLSPDGRMLPETEIVASKLCRDFWGRCVKEAGPGVQQRFYKHMESFFKSVESEAKSRADGTLPDIDAYMTGRRDNSGCRPCFDLIEYALGIDLPSHIAENHIIQTLSDCANDYIALTNDIFSYNVENYRGDNYNLVTIVMKSYNTDLQGAVDRIGQMSAETVAKYLETKSKLPSWGEEIDKDVAAYIHGLEDWMAGSLQWSFVTKRYFGESPEVVKQTGKIVLLSSATPKPIRTNAF
ncbi:hypothetical protein M422DRAFT_149816 [Sphaerobolus stellatus SS14]|nr:hypothetical protein M422DRAFT_149816 [Sphaerobolus stellatus SS14]